MGGVNYTDVADASGNWEVNVPNLTDGVYQMSVYVDDRWGNWRWSGDQVMVVDTFAPNFNYSSRTDTDASEHISWGTSSGTITGRSEPGSVFKLQLDGGVEETITLDSAGYWNKSFSELADGDHTLVMKATDKAGNEEVKTITLRVATVITLTDSGLTDATDTGASNSDNITSKATPTFEGTGKIGATVALTVAGQTYDTTVANNGTWQITVGNTIADGTYNYGLVITDSVNQSLTASGTVTIDTSALLAVDNIVAGERIFWNSTTGSLTGSAEADAVVTIKVGAETTLTLDGSANWTHSLVDLSEQTYSIEMKSVDIAGNETIKTFDLIVDLHAELSESGLTDATDSGVSNSDNITKNSQPSFEGTGEVGASIQFNVAGQDYSTTVGNDGTWRVDITTPINNGTHSYTVNTTDLAGNTTSRTGNITVDTSASLLINNLGAGNKIYWNVASGALTGSTEPGSVLTIKVDGGAEETLSLNGAGEWTKSLTGLSEAAHSIVVKTVDIAGNENTQTFDLVVDMSISLTQSGLTDATDTGRFNNDNLTNNNKPTFEGTGEAGADIAFSIAGQNYTTTVQPNGTWQVEITSPITDGTYTYDITTTDAAGNSMSRSGSVTIDTLAPDSLNLTLAAGQKQISGNLAGEAGASVTFTNNGLVLSDQVDSNGDYAVSTPPLSHGQDVYVAITDIAGNTRQEDYHI